MFASSEAKPTENDLGDVVGGLDDELLAVADEKEPAALDFEFELPAAESEAEQRIVVESEAEEQFAVES
jgi:hypothetical protein